MASHENVSMALFCDFENVALGVRDANYEKLDIRLVLEKLLLKGSIVIKKAYCDWDRYKGFKAAMHEANFELIEIPHVRQSGKNSADIRLVVDALDLCYTKSHLDTFVIISGDSDFSPLVSKLRENAKYVIGVGVKQSTSDLLIANCDEFIFYDDLVRETQRSAARRDARDNGAPPRRSPEDERRRKEEIDARRSKAIELATETFDALVTERGDSGKIWASALKDAIKRRKPDFNESYYGFRAFGNLLEEARARGLLEIGRDEKSGTFVYRNAGAGEGAGGDSDTPAPRHDGRHDGRQEGRPEGRQEARTDAPREGQRSRGRGRGERGRRSAGQADTSAPQVPAGDGDSASTNDAASDSALARASDNYNDNGYIYRSGNDSGDSSESVAQDAAMQSAGAPTGAGSMNDPTPEVQETEGKGNRRRHPVPARTAKAAAKKAAQDAARQTGAGDPFSASDFSKSDSAPSGVTASGFTRSDFTPSAATPSSFPSSPFRDEAPWDDARSSEGAGRGQEDSAGHVATGGEDQGQGPARKTTSNRRGTGRRTSAAKKAAAGAADPAGSDSVRADVAGTDAAPAGDAAGSRTAGRAPANRRSARKSTAAAAAPAASEQASTPDAAPSSSDTPTAAKRAPRKTATRARRPRKDDAE